MVSVGMAGSSRLVCGDRDKCDGSASAIFAAVGPVFKATLGGGVLFRDGMYTFSVLKSVRGLFSCANRTASL